MRTRLRLYRCVGYGWLRALLAAGVPSPLRFTSHPVRRRWQQV
jgi:hypothetical protein